MTYAVDDAFHLQNLNDYYTFHAPAQRDDEEEAYKNTNVSAVAPTPVTHAPHVVALLADLKRLRSQVGALARPSDLQRARLRDLEAAVRTETEATNKQITRDVLLHGLGLTLARCGHPERGMDLLLQVFSDGQIWTAETFTAATPYLAAAIASAKVAPEDLIRRARAACGQRACEELGDRLCRELSDRKDGLHWGVGYAFALIKALEAAGVSKPARAADLLVRGRSKAVRERAERALHVPRQRPNAETMQTYLQAARRADHSQLASKPLQYFATAALVVSAGAMCAGLVGLCVGLFGHHYAFTYPCVVVCGVSWLAAVGAQALQSLRSRLPRRGHTP